MTKRGVASSIITLAILLILLAVLFTAFYESLLPSIAHAAERFADSTLSKFKREKFQNTNIAADKSVEEIYENILSVLRISGNGPCLSSHQLFARDFKDFKITMSQTEQGIFVVLTNKQGHVVKRNTVSGKISCVVGEGEAAQNFYNNYLKGEKCTSNCLGDYSAADIVFDSGNSIIVNGQKRNLDDGNLVYVTENGNVCFFPTYTGLNPLAGCDASAKGLRYKCIDNIKINLRSCGEEKKESVFFGGTFYGAKSDWIISEGAYYYAGQDGRVPFMFRIVAKDITLGKKGLVNAEFNKAFTSTPQPVPQNEGIYYNNIYYGQKRDWRYKIGTFAESIATCNRCWVYIGAEQGVPEKFKIQGIVIEEKLRIFGPPGEE